MKGLVSVILIAAAWQAASLLGWLNPYLLPPPTKVLYAFKDAAQGGILFIYLAASLRRVLTGLALGFAAAVPLGVLAASRAGVRAYLLPVIELLRPVPPIAWIPLAILWFGGLRVEAGQRYEISDNRTLYLADVAQARKELVVFRIIEKLPWPDAGPSVHLLPALCRRARWR